MHTGGVRLPAALVVLVLVAGAAILSGCDGDPSRPTPTPTVEATPTAAEPARPPATPTAPAPTPTAEATPTVTTTPSPTPASSRTPTVTPSPTPTATPAPLVTAEDLGIREVDTAEALAAAGLTHARYEAGEEVPWDPGLFLLDVESGAVEGWVYSLAGLSGEQHLEAWRASDDISVSPGNRFLMWPSVLHDRHAGRTYAWDGSSMRFDRWWGAGANERLLFWVSPSDTFVALDGDLQPVAQFQIPPGERFTSPTGGYILVRAAGSSGTFHLVNLEDESNPRVHTWVLPGPADRIELLNDLVAFVGSAGGPACQVSRYDLAGVLLSNQTIPCRLWDETSLPRISPDGYLIAAATFADLGEAAYRWESVGAVVSIFEAASGTEVMRLLGVHPSWIHDGFVAREGVWLADSSGIIVQTRRGPRIAGLDAAWRLATGWASPDDPDLLFDYRRTPAGPKVVAINQHGDEQASLSFGLPSAAIPRPSYDAGLALVESAGWGARSDTLRIWTSYFYWQDYHGFDPPPPPLAPVIERPPFEDRLRAEVVVDTCLNLREEPSREAAIVTCLPSGAVVETDDYDIWKWPDSWMHLRTDDGLEGWASADYLRWHSDGARLEE